MIGEDDGTYTVHRPQVAIVAFTDLRTGAGNETGVLNCAKNWNSNKSDLAVVDTDWVFDGVEFMPIAEVEKILAPYRHIKVHEWFSKFRFVSRSKTAALFFGLALKPILYWVYGRTVGRGLFDELNRFDFVILMDNDCALAFPRRRKRKGAKLIGTTHCFSPTRLNMAVLSLFPFTWVHRVDYLQVFIDPPATFALRPNQIFRVPNGVDTNLYFSEPRIPGRPLRFLFAARLVEEKGVEQLLGAWRKALHHSRAELHIAGDGPLRETVRNSLPENVTFHGPLGLESLGALYRSCDVFVYPTRADTFAMVVGQALACGMYCIIGDCLQGVWDEFVRMGQAEYIDSYDESYLASRIDFMILNPDRIPLGNAKARDLIAKEYSWAGVVARLQEALAALKSESSI